MADFFEGFYPSHALSQPVHCCAVEGDTFKPFPRSLKHHHSVILLVCIRAAWYPANAATTNGRTGGTCLPACHGPADR